MGFEGPIEEYREVNVRGTLLVLQAAQNANVKSFIFLSTAQVLLGGPVIGGRNIFYLQNV